MECFCLFIYLKNIFIFDTTNYFKKIIMRKILLKTISVLLIGLFVVSCNKAKAGEENGQNSTAVAQEAAPVELTKEQKAMNSFVNTFSVLSGTMMYSMGGAFAGKGENSEEKLIEGIKEMYGKIDSVFSSLETAQPELYKTMVENPEFLKGADIVPEGEIGVKALTEDMSFDDIKAYIDKAIELSKVKGGEKDPFNVYLKASTEWAMQVSQEMNKNPEFTKLME